MAAHIPAHIIVVIRNAPSRIADGSVVDDFIYSHRHGQHIWKGKELTAEEFNEVWDEIDKKFNNAKNPRGKFRVEGVRPIFVPCAWPNAAKAREAKKGNPVSDDHPVPKRPAKGAEDADQRQHA